MRRRRAVSRKPAKAQQTIKAKRGTASKLARNRRLSALGKEKEVVRLARELGEAREQQVATAEVLRVISSSPSELDPVFQSMLANATHLCEANFGTLNLYRDGEFPLAATHNVPETFIQFRRTYPIIKPGPRHPLARVAASRQADR